MVVGASALLLIGTLGFLAIPEYDLSDAFYMTVITLSAVGYEEVHELHTGDGSSPASSSSAVSRCWGCGLRSSRRPSSRWTSLTSS